MFEVIDSQPDIKVQEREYTRLLGLPIGYQLNGRSRELADWARQWYEEDGRPWMYIRQVDALDFSNGQVVINGESLSSQRLRDYLAEVKADGAMLVAVSAGKELEEKARQLWNEEKPDEYFFLEVYRSAIVEHLVAYAAYRLCEWADNHRKAVLPHYSPGYPGWSISDQKKLLHTIRSGKHHRLPGDLDMFDSGMLAPKKSLLALFGITSSLEKAQRLTELIPCNNCSLSQCQYRRAPYRSSLPQIEGVQHLQSEPSASVEHAVNVARGHRYTFNTEALKKWSRDRLQLSFLDDRSVEGSFRYEGTTCSNLGRSLEFVYFVRLGPREDGYKILDASCVPAPGDNGHRFMCRYIENAIVLMKEIDSEKPLVGSRLGDIFEWERPYAPSGCYCTSVSRNHKWGLVLDVLHYALFDKNGKLD